MGTESKVNLSFWQVANAQAISSRDKIQLRNWNRGLILIPELDFFNGIGIDKFLIGIEVSYNNKIHQQINLALIFFIQKYFFHDNPTWNINYSE